MFWVGKMDLMAQFRKEFSLTAPIPKDNLLKLQLGANILEDLESFLSRTSTISRSAEFRSFLSRYLGWLQSSLLDVPVAADFLSLRKGLNSRVESIDQCNER